MGEADAVAGEMGDGRLRQPREDLGLGGTAPAVRRGGVLVRGNRGVVRWNGLIGYGNGVVVRHEHGWRREPAAQQGHLGQDAG